MIIKTFKWNRRMCVTILLILGLVLCAVVLLAGVWSRSDKNADKALRTNEDRVSYLENLGWEVAPEPIETREIVIPQELSGVFEQYNELQKQQGFDLSRHTGSNATLYSYQVTNYPSEGTVLANIYLIRYHVIAGDIHSTALDGFMHALK
jgi:hypothetical protein